MLEISEIFGMNEWLSSQACAYGFGVFGILVEWRAYSLRCGRRFRCWSAGGAVLWALQYAFLQAWTAALSMACTAARSLLSDRLASGAARHWAVFGFVVLFVSLAVLSWQGWVSLLPAFAVINTTLALFYLDNRAMRLVILLSSAAWIGNDFYWQAWPAMLAESVAVLVNLVTIRRLGQPDLQ